MIKKGRRGGGLGRLADHEEDAQSLVAAVDAKLRDEGQRRSRALFVAPRNDVEARVALVWERLLGCDTVGADDNFFALGGHSLSATQMLSHLQRELGVELPLRAVFEAPTVSALAQRIETTRAAAGSAAAPATIRRVNRGEAHPLSFSQERLWIIDRLEPNSTAYHMPGAVRLVGTLDRSALERALAEIVRRHEILRTVFVADAAGRPSQRVLERASAVLLFEDVSRLGAEAREVALQGSIEKLAASPFDLSEGPLLRLLLVRVEPDVHVLGYVMHHIVSDGWSLTVLVRELVALYGAFREGRPSPLPELPVQYVDYATWQRARLGAEELAAQLGYWRAKLAGSPPPVRLPQDQAVDGERGRSSGEVERSVSPGVTDALRALSTASGATLFMTTLATFQLLLSRYTGQLDVAVGTPVASRNPAETESLIGFFVNTLVLRTDLGGAGSFRSLLERVRETTLGAFDHQAVPFERLVMELNPDRGGRRNPFFDVLFNMLNVEQTTLALGSLRVEPISMGTESRFPLTLYLFDQRDGGLGLRLVYERSLYTSALVEHVADAYVALLDQVSSAADRELAEYSLVTPRARGVLSLGEGAPPATEALPTVVDEVRARAMERGEAVAVRCGPDRLGFAELVSHGEVLARALLDAGLRPGDVVGIVGARGCGVPVAMYAVWVAGGVTLTMDRNQPIERQKVMAEAATLCGLIVVGELTSAETSGFEPLASWVRRITRQGLLLGATPPERALHAPRSEDPAYVFFTSGTTGIPKGVLGDHRGVSHFVHWQRAAFQIGAADRAAQLTGMAFGVLLRDVWTPLTSGAELVVPPDDVDVGGAELVSWLAREEITLLHTVPSIMQAWLRSAEPRPLPLLRWIFSAGEPLRDGVVRKWREAHPGPTRIALFYGQTETTLAKTFYVVPEHMVPGAQALGRALPGAELLVLDERGRPCGIAEPGEIVLRTPYRTRGYLNANEEQARRFRTSPLTARADDVLYFTADRGRVRADGNVEALARKDLQVKVRGVRVELGEVESALLRHDRVTGGAVAAVEREGELALWAYVVCPAGEALEGSLRAWMRSQLPSELQPSGYVFLAELPRGKSGKIDRAALPAPTAGAPRRSGREPRTEVERDLLEIWRDVLGSRELGVEDDFFVLGGHSLLAMQLLSRVLASFQVKIELAKLFELPTVELLAGYIPDAPRVDSLPPIEPRAPGNALVLSAIQETVWPAYEAGVSGLVLKRTLEIAGPLEAEVLREALAAVHVRNECLRSCFDLQNGRPRLHIRALPTFGFAIHDIEHGGTTEERRATVAERMRARAEVPLLPGEPMVELDLYRLGPEQHVALLRMSHMVSDLITGQRILVEIVEHYAARRAGRPPRLAPLRFQYADYALWQQRVQALPAMERERRYWRARLEGARAIDLPTRDHGGGERAGGMVSVALSPEAHLAIRQSERAGSANAFHHTAAAYVLLLHQVSGQSDLCFLSSAADRQQEGTAEMIGWFNNHRYLRAAISPTQTLGQLLGQVRDGVFGDRDHAHLVVDSLPGLDDRLRHVNFAFGSLRGTRADVAPDLGLRLTPFELPAVGVTTVDFGLALWTTETDDEMTFRLGWQHRHFSDEEGCELARRYVQLVSLLIERPDVTVADAQRTATRAE